MIDDVETSDKCPANAIARCPMEANGWPRWKRLVIAELNRHERCISDNAKEIVMLKIESAKLIIKVGAIVGVVSAVMSSAASAVALKLLQ